MTSLVLTASCILGYTLVKRQFGMLEKQFCQTGTMLASQLSAGSVERVFTEDQLGLQSLVNSLNNNLPVVSAALINRDCKVLAMDGRQVPLPDEYQKKFLGKSGMFEGKDDIVWFYSPVIFKEVIGATAWVAMDRSELVSEQKKVIFSGGIVVSLLVLTITLVAIRLGRSLGRPVNELIKGAAAISSGDYAFRMQDSYKGEFAALARAFNSMAHGLEQKERVERTFSRFVSSPVAARYIAEEPADLPPEGVRVKASVVFADLSGYTAFSEGRDPEETARILNFYFSEFADICHACHGNVDKYIGDCAMMTFGCPQPDKDHHFNAMNCALQIQKRMAELNYQRRIKQLPSMDARIGITSGVLLAGLFGSRDRIQYTVVGEAANLAARLCELARPGQVLTDKAFYRIIADRFTLQVKAFRRIHIKGFRNGVEVIVIHAREKKSEIPAENFGKLSCSGLLR
jgi:adenylate cyclase